MNDSRFKLPEAAAAVAGWNPAGCRWKQEKQKFSIRRAGSFSWCSGQMNDKWHYMTETKLRDGSVLLAGGYANNDQGTAHTWIYRP
jgi:hypothetical protein